MVSRRKGSFGIVSRDSAFRSKFGCRSGDGRRRSESLYADDVDFFRLYLWSQSGRYGALARFADRFVGNNGVLAISVFLVGVYLGTKEFGPVGYLKNVCPELGLPWYLSFWVVPLLWVIEFASLFIKHAILALRLLANMVAGHAVLLGIMGLAVGVHAYAMSTGAWTALTGASLLGMTALSVLELFVAFLQAAVFTFLASMFIHSSMHHH